MELDDLIAGSGFLFTGFADISISIAILSVIQSALISLSSFFFIVPLFVAGFGLRGLWLWKTYKKEKRILYATASFLTVLLGSAVMIGLSIFVINLLDVLPVSSYEGNPYLVSLAALWTVYTVMEAVILLKNGGKLAGACSYGMIFGIALVDASILYIISIFQWMLPAAIAFVALLNFVLAADSFNVFSGLRNG